MEAAWQPPPLGPPSTPGPPCPALPLREGKYPPGVWPRGAGPVASDEGGMVLGALEAVHLGSPEGGLGQAGSCHMQPLLHLDPGGADTDPVCQGRGWGSRLLKCGLGWERKARGLWSESPPHHLPTQKDPHLNAGRATQLSLTQRSLMTPRCPQGQVLAWHSRLSRVWSSSFFGPDISPGTHS